MRTRLQAKRSDYLAEVTGAVYQPSSPEKGVFLLPVWGQDTLLSYPELVARDAGSQRVAGVVNHALLLHYFLTADGTPEASQWISYTDLPNGRFYTQAFQGYTGGELAKHFKGDQAAFEHAALKLGGTPQSFGDRAYAFKIFPRFSVLTVFWQGDEDFPSNFQILFSATANHYLPTDACAITGSMLTRKLMTEGS